MELGNCVDAERKWTGMTRGGVFWDLSKLSSRAASSFLGGKAGLSISFRLLLIGMWRWKALYIAGVDNQVLRSLRGKKGIGETGRNIKLDLKNRVSNLPLARLPPLSNSTFSLFHSTYSLAYPLPTLSLTNRRIVGNYEICQSIITFNVMSLQCHNSQIRCNWIIGDRVTQFGMIWRRLMTRYIEWWLKRLQ